MNEKEFSALCKREVAAYINNRYPISLDQLTSPCTEEDIYVVWICKTLQNNKALLSTDYVRGMYFECTYNGNARELYLDAYVKEANQCILV